ncbi:hypothetical protein HOD96_01155 [Candidatus Falkowbacteria bacterium]|mgnify:CR=1 FL=1|jgi:hypothetical protein|nr:hypothetical protein [Candidatus Falkowbacteria bacterium]MBT4432927.1 hypothetical protein [Candidatus Falkowbacteria bacterium]
MNLKFEKIKYYFLSLCLLFYSFPVFAAQPMDIRSRLKVVGTGEGEDGDGIGAGYSDIGEGGGEMYFAEKLGALISVLLTFLGIIFLLLMIYGGFMWMTAEGNTDRVEKAKKILTNSTIGLIIVMLAYSITWFVVYKLGNATGFNPDL